MEPTTSPMDCAAVEAATQKSMRAAASNFMVPRRVPVYSCAEKTLVGPILRFVCNAGAGRRFPCVVLTGLLVLGAAANGAAQPVQKQVLVLQSVDRGNIVVDHFTDEFSCRTGPARRTTGELRASRRGPDRVGGCA